MPKPTSPVLVLKSQVRASPQAQAVYKLALLDMQELLEAKGLKDAAEVVSHEAAQIKIEVIHP